MIFYITGAIVWSLAAAWVLQKLILILDET